MIDWTLVAHFSSINVMDLFTCLLNEYNYARPLWIDSYLVLPSFSSWLLFFFCSLLIFLLFFCARLLCGRAKQNSVILLTRRKGSTDISSLFFFLFFISSSSSSFFLWGGVVNDGHINQHQRQHFSLLVFFSFFLLPSTKWTEGRIGKKRRTKTKTRAKLRKKIEENPSDRKKGNRPGAPYRNRVTWYRVFFFLPSFTEIDSKYFCL